MIDTIRVFDNVLRKLSAKKFMSKAAGLLNCAERKVRYAIFHSNFAIFVLSTKKFNDSIINENLLIILQIPETEGASLAASHSVGFTEISVAENSPNLYKVFEKLLIESRGRPVKPRKFSVSKMIGKN